MNVVDQLTRPDVLRGAVMDVEQFLRGSGGRKGTTLNRCGEGGGSNTCLFLRKLSNREGGGGDSWGSRGSSARFGAGRLLLAAG